MLSDEIKERQKTLKEDNLIDRYNELNFILPVIKQQEALIKELLDITCLDCEIKFKSDYCKPCKAYNVVQKAKEFLK